MGIFRVLSGFDTPLAIFCRRNEYAVGTWAKMNGVRASLEAPGDPLCLAGADRLVAFWDGEDPAIPAAVADAKERGIPSEVWL